MSIKFASPAELAEHVGESLGTTTWEVVTQERIDQFADATGDHQWIHVDAERAAAGPFGTTIAHGYLTLSLAAGFSGQLLNVDNVGMAVNYGLNKVRFAAPVPAGSRVRATGALASVRERGAAVEATVELTYELEGGERPPCVAEVIVLLWPA